MVEQEAVNPDGAAAAGARPGSAESVDELGVECDVLGNHIDHQHHDDDAQG
eukprot:SAG22_NODE_2398_length_2618_cov_1.421199_2_plen_51_part_00